jgi:hypothetical protein
MARRGFEQTTNMVEADGNPEGWSRMAPQGGDFGDGRSLPSRSYLHQRTHPTPVGGCFACRIASVGVSLPPHASTRGDGIDVASALKREHEAMARAHPDGR